MRANGAALRAVLRRWRGHPALDDAFADNVADATRAVSPELDDDPWFDELPQVSARVIEG